MNATLTTLPHNVCRVEGVPPHLLGKLMVRIFNASELKNLQRLAPNAEQTALELYGIDYEGRAILRRLLSELEAQDVLDHLPPSFRSSLHPASGGIPCPSSV